MLKGLLLRLLVRVLGDYVEGITSDALQLSVWAGKVALRNLKLRREALDKLGLPVQLQAGNVGLVSVTVPWSSLDSDPVSVVISDVSLLVDKVVMSETEVARREESAKVRALAAAAIIQNRARAASESKDDEFDSTRMGRYLKLALDNLQVTLENVHLRYEDSTSHKGNPFACGLTLERFTLATTDAHGNRTFVDRMSKSEIVHREARVRNFSVYWDPMPPGSEILELSDAERQRAFRAGISTGRSHGRAPLHEFIIEPSDATVSVAINETLLEGHPKVSLAVVLDRPRVRLTHRQYVDMTFLHRWVTLLSNPKARFQFAWKVVTGRPPPRKGIDWDCIVGLGKMRRRYVTLFERSLGGDWVPKPEDGDVAELETIEARLTYEQALLFRAVAERRWRSKRDSRARAASAAGSSAAAPPAAGGRSWLMSIFSGPSPAEVVEAARPLARTAEEHAEMYADINIADIQAAAEPPASLVLLAAAVTLRDASLRLVHHSGVDLVSASIAGSYRMQTRAKSWELDVALDEVRITDLFSKDSAFPRIVTEVETATSSAGAATGRRRKGVGFVRVEQNPPGGDVDLRVRAESRPLVVVVNPALLRNVIAFFDSPGDTELRALTARRLADIQEATRAKVLSTIGAHARRVDVHLVVHAPQVVVPFNPAGAASDRLNINLGQLRFQSLSREARAPEAEGSGESKSGEADDDDGTLPAPPHPSLLELSSGALVQYDFWRIELDGANVSVQAPAHESSPLVTHTLLDSVSCGIDLRTAILPKSLTPDRLKVHVQLPDIQVTVSPASLLFLSRLGGEVSRTLTAVEGPRDDPPAELAAATGGAGGAGGPGADPSLGMEWSVQRIARESGAPTVLETQPASQSLAKIEVSFTMPSAALHCQGFNDLGAGTKTLRTPPPREDSLVFRVGTLQVELGVEGTQAAVHCSLSGVQIVDSIQPNGPDWELFATSYVDDHGLPKRASKEADEDAEHQLITVAIDSDWTSGVTTQSVELAFNELHVQWNPETVLRLQQLGTLAGDEFVAHRGSTANGESTSATAAAASCSEVPVTDAGQIKLHADIRRLSLTLNKEHSARRVARIQLAGADIKFEDHGSWLQYFGTVSHLSMQDLCTEGTRYPVVVNQYDATSPLSNVLDATPSSPTRDAAMIVFKFENWRRGVAGRPEYDSKIQLELRPLRICYLNQLWLEITDYLANGLLGPLTAGGDDPASSEVRVSDIPRVLFDVVVRDPQLIVPSGATADAWASATIADITYRNRIESRTIEGEDTSGVAVVLDTILDISTITVNGLTLQSQSGADICSSVPSLGISFTRSPDKRYNSVAAAANEIEIDVADSIALTLSKAHYRFLMCFLDDNLGAPHPEVFAGVSGAERATRAVQYDYEKNEGGTSRLACSMAKLRLTITEGETDARSFGAPIACFEINELDYGMQIAKDRSVAQVVSIGLIQAVDQRPAAVGRAFRRMIAPTDAILEEERGADAGDAVMFEFSQTTQPDGAAESSLTLNDSCLVLIPDLLHDVLEYSAAPVAPSASTASSVSREVRSESKAAWKLDVSLVQPQIAVLTDPAAADCGAVALRGNVTVHLSGSGDVHRISEEYSLHARADFSEFVAFDCAGYQLSDPPGEPFLLRSSVACEMDVQRKASETLQHRRLTATLSRMQVQLGHHLMGVILSVKDRFLLAFDDTSDTTAIVPASSGVPSAEDVGPASEELRTSDSVEFSFDEGLVVTMVEGPAADAESPLVQANMTGVHLGVTGTDGHFSGAASFALSAQWWHADAYHDLVLPWAFECDLRHDAGHILDVKATTPLHVSLTDKFTERVLMMSSRLSRSREAAPTVALLAEARSGGVETVGESPDAHVVDTHTLEGAHFGVSVSVPAVQLELSVVEMAGTSRGILDVAMAAFDFSFEQQPSARIYTLGLASLMVSDLCQPDESPFRRLVSSRSEGLHAGSVSSGATPQLFRARVVERTRLEGGIPRATREGSVTIDTLVVQWNPETIAALQRYATKSLLAQGGDDDAVADGRRVTVHDVLESSSSGGSAAPPLGTTADMDVIVSVRDFHLVFNKERINRQVGVVCATQFECKYRTFASGDESNVDAKLGDLVVLDTCTSGTLYQQVWGRKHAGDREALVTVSLQAFGPARAAREGADSKLIVEVLPTSLVYLQQFWMEFLDYTLHGLLGALVVSAAEDIQQFGAEQSVKKNILDVRVKEPTLVIPRSATSSDSTTVMLQWLAVTNEITNRRFGDNVYDFNVFHVALRTVALTTTCDGAEAFKRPIPEVSVTVTMAMQDAFPPQGPTTHGEANMVIDCVVPDVAVVCSEEFYSLIRQTSDENFAAIKYNQTEEQARCAYLVPTLPEREVAVNHHQARCGGCGRDFSMMVQRRACEICGVTQCVPCTVDRVYDKEHQRACHACKSCLAAMQGTLPAAVSRDARYEFDADNSKASSMKFRVGVRSLSLHLTASGANLALAEAKGLVCTVFKDTERVMTSEVEMTSLVVTDTRPTSVDRHFTTLVAPSSGLRESHEVLRTSSRSLGVASAAEESAPTPPQLVIRYTAAADGVSDLTLLLSSLVVNVIVDLLLELASFAEYTRIPEASLDPGRREPATPAIGAAGPVEGLLLAPIDVAELASARMAPPQVTKSSDAASSMFSANMTLSRVQVAVIESLESARSNIVLVSTSLVVDAKSTQDAASGESANEVGAMLHGLEAVVVFGGAPEVADGVAEEKAMESTARSGGGGGGGSAAAVDVGRAHSHSDTDTGMGSRRGFASSRSRALQLLPLLDLNLHFTSRSLTDPVNIMRRDLRFSTKNDVDVRLSYNDMVVVHNVATGWLAHSTASDGNREAPPAAPAESVEFDFVDGGSAPQRPVLSKVAGAIVVSDIAGEGGPAMAALDPHIGDILVSANGVGVENASESALAALMRRDREGPVLLRFRAASDSLAFSAPTMRLTAVNNIGGRCTPLLSLVAKDVDCRVHGNSSLSDWQARVATQLSTSYFNLSNASWEPALEPWSVKCVAAKLRALHGNTDEAVDFNQDVVLSADNLLRINLTHSLFETLSSAVNAYKSMRQAQPKEEQQAHVASRFVTSRSGFSEYVFVNDSGLAVQLSLQLPGDSRVPAINTDPGQRVPLVGANGESLSAVRLDAKQTSRATCRLSIEHVSEPLDTLPIDRVGNYVREIRYGGLGQLVRVYWSVELVNGAKVLSLRSRTAVVNKTDTPLEVFAGDATTSQSCGIVQPHSSIHVPICFVEFLQLRVRPQPTEFGEYGFSGPISSGVPMSMSTYCKFTSAHSGSGDYLPHFFVQCRTMITETTTVEICPPVTLENLLPQRLQYSVALREVKTGKVVPGLLNAGERVALHDVEATSAPSIRVGIEGYIGLEWTKLAPAASVDSPRTESMVNLMGRTGSVVRVMVRVDTSVSGAGDRRVTVFAPFWTIDRTGLQLAYGAEESGGKIAPMVMNSAPEAIVAFEYSEYHAASGWGEPTSAGRSVWSDERGRAVVRDEIDRSLSAGWKWDSSWVVDPTGGADSGGWDYAVDFGDFAPGRTPRGQQPLDGVRRRRWVRTRVATGASVPDTAAAVARGGASLCVTTPRDGALHVRRGAGPWSEALPLWKGSVHAADAGGGLLEVVNEGGGVHELAVEFAAAPEPFLLTRTVVLRPRFSIHNRTSAPLAVRQAGSRSHALIQPGESQPFHWIHARLGRRVQICDRSRVWSGEFDIHAFDEFPLLVGDTVYRVVCAPDERHGFVQCVHIARESRSRPLYCLRNVTDAVIEFKQETHDGPWQTLRPQASATLGWASVVAGAPRTLLVRAACRDRFGEAVRFDLDVLDPAKCSKTLRSPGGRGGQDSINALLTTQLSLTKELIFQPTSWAGKIDRTREARNVLAALQGSSDGPSESNATQRSAFSWQLALPHGIEVSTIDSVPEEIAVLAVHGIAATVKRSKAGAVSTTIKVDRVQLDDVVPSAVAPVVLAPLAKVEPPVLQVSARLELNPAYHRIRALVVQLNPLVARLSLDLIAGVAELQAMLKLHSEQLHSSRERAVVAVARVLADESGTSTLDSSADDVLGATHGKGSSFGGAAGAGGAGGPGIATGAATRDDRSAAALPATQPRLDRDQSSMNVPPMLRPIVVDMMCIRAIRCIISMSKRRSDRRSDFEHEVEKLGWLGHFLVNSISLDNAPLQLGDFLLTHRRLRLQQLMSALTAHYQAQLTSELLPLITGLSPIGNLSSMAGHIGSRFEEEGVLSGIGSIIESGAVGVGGATQELLGGLFSGITGLVRSPIEGGREGAGGVLKGIGTGLLGLVVKPALGVTKASGKLLEGGGAAARASEAERSLTPLRRRRTLYGRFKVLKPYSEDDEHNARVYFSRLGGKGGFVGATSLGRGRHAIVSSREVAVVQGGSVVGRCKLGRYTHVEIVDGNLLVIGERASSLLPGYGAAHDTSIDAGDRGSAAKLAALIRAAVTE